MEIHPGWGLGCHTTASVHRQLTCDGDGEVMRALALVVIVVVVVVVVVVTMIINNIEAVWVRERRTK